VLEYYQRPQFAPFSLEHPASDEARLGVMLVHGFTGSPADMRPLAELMFELGADCHAIGLPGHGLDIANLQSATEIVWRDSVIAAWDDHCRRYRRPILVGYSMGGAAAIQMAARTAPELLILLAPFVRINDRRALLLPVAGRFVKEVRLLANLDFDDPVIRQWIASALPDLEIDDPEIRRRLREETGIASSVINELRKFGATARRVAPQVTAPVAILQGHQDIVVNPHDARKLSDAFPSLQAYHEFPADHLLTLANVPWWPRVRSLVLEELSGHGPFSSAPSLRAGAPH
jgi:carboxylesterase